MFSLYIAKRYLITKKSHNVINIISGISIFGIAIATAALVCILSVFNGFQDMVANLFTAFDPELKIVSTQGKFMNADSKELQYLKNNDNIAVYSEVLQDNALLLMNNNQMIATIKGVDDNFEKLIDFERIKFGDGKYELHADVIDYGIFGINILSNLGTDVSFSKPIQVYAPRREGAQIDMNDPSESFNNDELYSPNVAFSVKQQKYDSNYVITSLRFARNLFERDGMISSIELKLKNGANIDKAKANIAKQLGDKYKVMDRYEQQEDTFKIMKIEKLISYIFLTFILLIACFNIIGSISMLIIDKKNDIVILRNIGASERQISNIFMIEGRLISFIGAIVGILLGVLLCLLQQKYGIIKFGQSAGSYIIDSYPVSVHLTDILIILLTVVVVGFVSVWYPVRQLSRKYTTVITLFTVCALFSCNSNENSFKINGELEGMPNGQLYIYNLNDETARFDTIYINKGEFAYGGSVSELTPYALVFPNALEQIIFVTGGANINYRASTNDLRNYTVDGNEENEIMNKFRKEIKGLSGIQVQEVARQFINSNPSSAAAVYLFDRYFIQDDTTPLETIKEIVKLLKKNNTNNSFILSIENQLKSVEAGQVGKKISNISLVSKLKHKINLYDIKSEYIALVYFSSWMPNQYNFIDEFALITKKYSENKVKFITISIDTEIYKWEDYIREDTMYCEHCCDGQAWDSPAVEKLGVTEIPTYILIGKNHKIVARGNSLSGLREDLKKFVEAE